MKTQTKKLLTAYIMASIGSLLILLWAVNYLFGMKWGLPPAVLGIIFLAIGLANARKAKTTSEE